MNKPDESRLPKWAQRQLASLRANNEALLQEVTKLDACQTQVVQQADYGTTPRMSYLRDRAVYFLPRPGLHVLDGFAVDLEDEELTVRGPGLLHIIPWATNCFRVKQVER